MSSSTTHGKLSAFKLYLLGRIIFRVSWTPSDSKGGHCWQTPLPGQNSRLGRIFRVGFWWVSWHLVSNQHRLLSRRYAAFRIRTFPFPHVLFGSAPQFSSWNTQAPECRVTQLKFLYVCRTKCMPTHYLQILMWFSERLLLSQYCHLSRTNFAKAFCFMAPSMDIFCLIFQVILSFSFVTR